MLYNKLKDSKSKSLIINTVHDSVVIDVFPGEEDIVADVAYKSMTRVTDLFFLSREPIIFKISFLKFPTE